MFKFFFLSPSLESLERTNGQEQAGVSVIC